MKQIFHNGVFYSMNEAEETYDYMSVNNGKIEKMGKGSPTIPCDVQEIDLQGRFVCPGFIDTHMHLLGYGAFLNECDLTGSTSIESFKERIESFKEKTTAEWLAGGGWNHDFFIEKRLPNRYDLDAVCADRPVILYRACCHIAVVNSFVIDRFNISVDEEIEGGSIDHVNGIPTGILRENAIDLVSCHMPANSELKIRKYFSDAQAELFKVGITSVQTDDLPYVNPEEYQMLIDIMGTLEDYPLRISEQIQYTTPETIKKFTALGYKTGWGNNHFRIGPLKILADGSLGARTAKLTKPYADDLETDGILIYTPEMLDRLIEEGINQKMDLAVHAIGDKTNELIQHSIVKHEKRKDARHAIIHSQIMSDELIDKMATTNISALVQPVFLEYDMSIAEARVGKDLTETSYAYKTMLEKGIKLGFGSDCPVEAPNPFRSIHYAVTRKRPDGTVFYPNEAIDIHKALKAFTSDAAYFSREEALKGQLKEGYLADFIVLNRDPLKSEFPDLLTIKVDETYIDGNCVYKRDL